MIGLKQELKSLGRKKMFKFLTVFIFCLFGVGCSEDVPVATDATVTDAVDAAKVSVDEGPADIAIDNGRLLGPITHVELDCGVQPMDTSGIPGC